jgi:amino acid transporter
VFVGSRRGIRFEVVGVVSALIVLFIWASLQMAVACRRNGSCVESGSRLHGGAWHNFLNWVESGQGQTFGVFLIGAMILILLFSVVNILGKRPGGTSNKNRARDEPSPEPNKRE